jgi:hypothetical protein
LTDSGAHSHPAPELGREVVTQQVTIPFDGLKHKYVVAVPAGKVAISGSLEIERLNGTTPVPNTDGSSSVDDKTTDMVRVLASRPDLADPTKWEFVVSNSPYWTTSSGQSYRLTFFVVAING